MDCRRNYNVIDTKPAKSSKYFADKSANYILKQESEARGLLEA